MGACTKWSLVVSDVLRNAMVHFYSQVAMKISRAEGGLAGKIHFFSNSFAAQRPEKIDKKWRSGPKHAGSKERHQRGVMWGLLRLQRGENGQPSEGSTAATPTPRHPPHPQSPPSLLGIVLQSLTRSRNDASTVLKGWVQKGQNPCENGKVLG